MNKRQIESIKARQILGSRGNPTLEAVVVLNDGSIGRALSHPVLPPGNMNLPSCGTMTLRSILEKV